MSNERYPRSPKVLLGGMAHLARLIDKVRLRHAGGIADYNYLTSGFDKALLDFLQVDPQEFEERVLSGATDDELLDWVRVHGRPLRQADIQAWTKHVLTAKPGDAAAVERYRGRLAAVAAKRGVPIDSLPPASTWVDAIELDEGRL